MIKTIYLIDLNQELIECWKTIFKDNPEIKIILRDYFSAKADAIVSPANCFGIMDGGLDLAIRYQIPEIDKKVQAAILEKYHGEIPVGCAEVIPTDHTSWPYLICAPTMRIPESIRNSIGAYSAFRAVLLAIKRHNDVGEYLGYDFAKKINSVVCCGLGTGVGQMEPSHCAIQMYEAYKQVLGNGKIPPFREIHKKHHEMTGK